MSGQRAGGGRVPAHPGMAASVQEPARPDRAPAPPPPSGGYPRTRRVPAGTPPSIVTAGGYPAAPAMKDLAEIAGCRCPLCLNLVFARGQAGSGQAALPLAAARRVLAAVREGRHVRDVPGGQRAGSRQAAAGSGGQALSARVMRARERAAAGYPPGACPPGGHRPVCPCGRVPALTGAPGGVPAHVTCECGQQWQVIPARPPVWWREAMRLWLDNLDLEDET
jgi:hypothetical protein